MNKQNIYKGKGTADMYDDFLDFINYVFGFNGNNQDFLKLLPKLYKKEYHPCENNYVVTENGKLKAAIGSYRRDLQVLDKTLHIQGIGNVAVHPYARSKGYMIDTMNLAMADMLRDGADLADLGGLRQRYGYFSFEKCAPLAKFTIHDSNIRHCFRDVPMRSMKILEITDPNHPVLDTVYALYSQKPNRILRSREAFMDIITSCFRKLHVIYEGEECIGYYVGDMTELTLKNKSDFVDVIRNYIVNNSALELTLPLYETEMIADAQRICESMFLLDAENYTVFHYAKVLDALFALKASVLPLMDGSMTIQINGYAGMENIRISVECGIPSVTSTNEPPMLTLEHKEAMSFFFGTISPIRTRYPLAVSWFPLPLYIDPADHV